MPASVRDHPIRHPAPELVDARARSGPPGPVRRATIEVDTRQVETRDIDLEAGGVTITFDVPEGHRMSLTQLEALVARAREQLEQAMNEAEPGPATAGALLAGIDEWVQVRNNRHGARLRVMWGHMNDTTPKSVVHLERGCSVALGAQVGETGDGPALAVGLSWVPGETREAPAGMRMPPEG